MDKNRRLEIPINEEARDNDIPPSIGKEGISPFVSIVSVPFYTKP